MRERDVDGLEGELVRLRSEALVAADAGKTATVGIAPSATALPDAAAHFLPKPYTPRQLLQRVRLLLDPPAPV